MHSGKMQIAVGKLEVCKVEHSIDTIGSYPHLFAQDKVKSAKKPKD
jgi:hypothetical protein